MKSHRRGIHTFLLIQKTVLSKKEMGLKHTVIAHQGDIELG